MRKTTLSSHHTIKITAPRWNSEGNFETLVLTFSTYKAATEAYWGLPKQLRERATIPRREHHKVYNSATVQTAIDDATSFFG